MGEIRPDEDFPIQGEKIRHQKIVFDGVYDIGQWIARLELIYGQEQEKRMGATQGFLDYQFSNHWELNLNGSSIFRTESEQEIGAGFGFKPRSKLFPEAQDYSTITIKLTSDHIASIEKRLGSTLDDSEKHEFNFYELKSKQAGKIVTLGHAVALGGKGEYGVIEVVIGMEPNRKIRAAYIQRSSERMKKEIESPSFLNQFQGKSTVDPLEFGKDLKNAPTAITAGNTVRLTIKKMLAFYEELLPKQNLTTQPEGKTK